MAQRTTPTLVAKTLGNDYDGSANLNPSIDTAGVHVRRIITRGTELGITVEEVDLEIIERWLAAHFYACSDRPYQSRSTLNASGSMQGQTGMGLTFTVYGQQAIALDPTGYLATIGKGGKVARGVWAGTNVNDALDYDDVV